MSDLGRRIAAALEGSVLAEGLGAAAERFAERRGGDPGARALQGAPLRGLARLLASQPEAAAYLANRPEWLEQAAGLDAARLGERAAGWEADGEGLLSLDLEEALDALRLRRHDEMALAACAHLGGLADFEVVSEHLSRLAEVTARSSLELARREMKHRAPSGDFAVIGMGRVAGREFTYHSDLDLIFLFRGDTSEIDRATRIGQRMIAYLTTRTGAGVAYPVDTRLRPSGQQGMLVTSFEGFERYQIEQAATWEHLAMLRARPIAGAEAEAAERLAHVRDRVLPTPEPPWGPLAELRKRVEDERATRDDGATAFKTGPGGLMDVDFLAGGGLLERGAAAFPAIPSAAAMLRAAVGGGAAEALLDDARTLREVEAAVRWVSARPSETLPESLDEVAELVEPGLSGEALRERVRGARLRIRERYARVVAGASITAL